MHQHPSTIAQAESRVNPTPARNCGQAGANVPDAALTLLLGTLFIPPVQKPQAGAKVWKGRPMRTASIIAAAMLAALPATAAGQPAAGQGVTAAADARQVSVEVREAGRVVAASSVKLQLGRPAAISMEGPYAMRLRVDAAETGYTIRPNLTANGPSGWTPLRTPSFSVSAGQSGKALVERPSGPPIELAIKID